MMIRLLSTQIVQYWEIIKFSLKNTDNIENMNLSAYFNSILHDLLSDNAQCFFRINPDNRKIYTVIITRIKENKFTGIKTLIVRNVYSFRVANLEVREMERNFLKEFAIKRECSLIVFRSPNKNAWKLGESLGFKEVHRTYMYKL